MDVIFRQVGRMQRTLSVRSWPFWKLPRTLAAFVAAVILADLAGVRGGAAAVPVRVHDLEVFALLLACNAATVELTRRGSENRRATSRTCTRSGNCRSSSCCRWPTRSLMPGSAGP